MSNIVKSQWIELRTTTGKLVAKFDPIRDLIEIKHKDEVVIFDLAQIREKVALEMENSSHTSEPE